MGRKYNQVILYRREIFRLKVGVLNNFFGGEFITKFLILLQMLMLEEYSRSSQQLVHQDPERPEVHGPVVSLVEDDLRSHVLRGPTERPGLTTAVNVLRKAKIDHFNVALFICKTLAG